MTNINTMSPAAIEMTDEAAKRTSEDRNSRMQKVQLVAADAVATAKNLFSSNVHCRLLHYTRVATLNAPLNANPRSFVLNIVGHAGLGKTALVRHYAKTMGIAMRTLQVGGITDIADLVGMHKPVARVLKKADGTEMEVQRTILALPQWYPDLDLEPNGIILFDDYNRGLPHILQGVMQLLIDRAYNELEIPMGWTSVATSNPDGDDYNVTTVDSAQITRTITVAYNRPAERFFEQLQAQDVDPRMQNFWIRYPELVKTEKQFSIDAGVVSKAMNDRLRMIWNHLYPYLALDQEALYEVGMSLFGSRFMQNLEAYLQSEQPLEPMQILNTYDAVSHKVVEHIKTRRSDLTAVAVQRLAFAANDAQLTLTDEQVNNIARYMVDLSKHGAKEFSFNLCQRLIAKNAPKAQFYAVKLSKFRSNGADNGEVNQIIREMLLNLQGA